MLPLAALAALALPLSTLAHGHHGHTHANSRKTLNFHPHPHRDGRTLDLSPHQADLPSGFAAGKAGRQAFVELARSALKDGEDGTDWFVRDDSYTDPRTLTTHIYVRQLVDGLEVADGDANLNFGPDGRLLSAGNSFFKGSLPSSSSPAAAAAAAAAATSSKQGVYASHCAALLDRLTTTAADFRARLSTLREDDAVGHLLAFGHDQVAFGFGRGGSAAAEQQQQADEDDVEEEEKTEREQEDDGELEKVSQAVKELGQLVRSMCPSSTASAPGSATELALEQGASRALLAFLALVHPDEQLGSSLARDPSAFLGALESTFTPPSFYAPGPKTPTEHIRNAPGVVGDEGAKASLAWLQTDDGLKLVWRLELEMADNWYEGAVEVGSGKVLAAVDWARDAPSAFARRKADGSGNKGKKSPPGKDKKDGAFKPEYRVWPLGVNDPSVGNRSLLTGPHDVLASPAGWHAIPLSTSPFLSTTPGVTVDAKAGWVNTTTTLGNNVFAQENWEGQGNWVANYRPVVKNGSFDFPYGEEEGLRPKEYADLAITELFYTCNMFHDLTYRWGFDELAGNFQEANFGKGGKGNDAVIANAQDGSGTNNANFATPPDGQHGRMRMYVWDTATPYRDGDLEAGIVIHEYAHGVSTRLTGGPANSGCLGWGEAGGMGEGWGDFFATQIRKTAEGGAKTRDFPMGAWAANRAGGIRNFPYSTNSTVNPSTYKTLDKGGYFGVHAIGEVWAQFLFVMTENLIAKHGFSSTLFPPTDPAKPNDYYTATAELDASGALAKPLVPKHGNTLAVQLVMNGMKLQPCRPSFFDARDAIVQADQILTGGSNACEIWSAFADRGLGPDAALRGATPWGGGIRIEDYSLPKGICKDKKKKDV